MSYALPLVVTVVAVILLSGCGAQEFIDRQPPPLGTFPPSTLVRLPVSYPTFTTVAPTEPPCDLPPVICAGGP